MHLLKQVQKDYNNTAKKGLAEHALSFWALPPTSKYRLVPLGARVDRGIAGVDRNTERGRVWCRATLVWAADG